MITGNMQVQGFNLVNILKHAARWHYSVEVVTNSVESGIHRINYGELYARNSAVGKRITQDGY